MEFFKITRNGVEIKNALTSEEVSKIFPAIIEDYTDGYIYDDETGEVFNEVDKSLIVAKDGDKYAQAGDDYYEVIEDND